MQPKYFLTILFNIKAQAKVVEGQCSCIETGITLFLLFDKGTQCWSGGEQSDVDSSIGFRSLHFGNLHYE